MWQRCMITRPPGSEPGRTNFRKIITAICRPMPIWLTMLQQAGPRHDPSGCWAHARRHFHNAVETDPSRMRTVLLLIAHIYGIERTARERALHGEDLRLPSERGSRSVLERLLAFLLEIQDEVLPKSEAGQPVAYTFENWTALTRYCENPHLSIDNNHTERAMRCFAVGRANWISTRMQDLIPLVNVFLKAMAAGAHCMTTYIPLAACRNSWLRSVSGPMARRVRRNGSETGIAFGPPPYKQAA